MIDLHERLSEYSYGFGVTRETEKLLSSVGIRAVPFLPSLIHEKELGFDVGFKRPGAALLLQFKLGHSLRNFRRTNLALPPPLLDRPYWRFSIDTSELDGQYETLLRAELDGAEAYYVAPRFSDWTHYAKFFDSQQVLENSLLIQPSEIRKALEVKGDPDGPHRIVYDQSRVHVCSDPMQISGVNSSDLINKVSNALRERKQPLGELLEQVFKGFEDRSSVRRISDLEEPEPTRPGLDSIAYSTSRELSFRSTVELARSQRARRLEKFLDLSRSRERAVAAAVGLELWALGVQLVVAVEDDQ